MYASIAYWRLTARPIEKHLWAAVVADDQDDRTFDQRIGIGPPQRERRGELEAS